ncbi:hypothetical protein ABK040_003941 [Willaertia magna]
MRELTSEEMEIFFDKLTKYIGKNIKQLINDNHSFRYHNDRIYYVSNQLLQFAQNISNDRLKTIGTCFGKFTKSKKFRLEITCLDYLSQYAEFKVWLKPQAELSYLYGNHVLKTGLGRITEDTPSYQGVVIYNMNDIPLGFGVTAKSTEECRYSKPTDIVCFHQADVGQYLRDENGTSEHGNVF